MSLAAKASGLELTEKDRVETQSFDREGRLDWWKHVVRPVLAWLAACYAAGVAIISLLFWSGVLSGGHSAHDWTLFVMAPVAGLLMGWIPGLHVAVLTSLPMPFIVFVIRLNTWRRGRPDVLLSGVMGAVLSQLMVQQQWEDSPSVAAMWTAVFFVAGMVGGWVYCALAGHFSHCRRRGDDTCPEA
ncbi:hypothetical protein RMQ97_05690 [Maricaulis sp. D1M11]|uniref:hypothetical protein n=1 Tax=Maricaulis sp. D1M11 TaxID=3076117 RepID=UPI0039B4E3F1